MIVKNFVLHQKENKIFHQHAVESEKKGGNQGARPSRRQSCLQIDPNLELF